MRIIRNMNAQPGRPPRLAITAAVLAAAGLLGAGCGGSSASPSACKAELST